MVAGTVQPVTAQTLDVAVAEDLTSWRTGFVVALVHRGERQFLEAFGHPPADRDTALSSDAVFAFPALTEVLVGLTVEALDDAGVVDAGAPLSRYLPSLDSVVGTATLAQLVTHTAGLDNAARIEGETWARTLDRIDDRALVASPGTVYSKSRHSLPLAARVLERALGRPVTEVATAAILAPLGMTSSTFDLAAARRSGLVAGVERSDEVEALARPVEPRDTVGGLPVLFTTTPDVLRLLSAWMEGRIRGRPPQEVAVAEHPVLGDARRYGGGVWVDRWQGRTRVYRVSSALGTSAGFYLLPDTRTVVFLWAAGEWPRRTAAFVMDRVGEAVGSSGWQVRPPGRSEAGTERPPPDPDRWAGTYRNGELIFELRNTDGALTLFDGSRELALRREGETTVVAYLPDGRAAVRLELRTDGDGRRFLYYGNLAYRHLDDVIGR